MISFDQLAANILQIAKEFAPHISGRSVQRATVDCLGYVLSQDVLSTLDLPRSDVSAMDGYALPIDTDHPAGQSYRIIGEAMAGQPLRLFAAEGAFDNDAFEAPATIRITTGATVPTGYDTVVMQENTQADSQQMTLTQAQAVGGNVRKAGEEITAGETVLPSGTVVQAQHIALLSAMGMEQLDVVAPIKVGLLASGDELVSVGTAKQEVQHDNQKIYDCNTPTLQALMAGLPVQLVDYGILPDDEAQTCERLQTAANACDVLISTAGVSVGKRDFLASALEQLGTVISHKVAMKPGKPFALGYIPKTENQPIHDPAMPAAPTNMPTLFFGLPGNPVSVFVGGQLLVKPAIYQLTGASQPPSVLGFAARSTVEMKKKPGRRDFQRGVLSVDADGNWTVGTAGKQQSHRIKGLAMSNALIDLPADAGPVQVGDNVRVLPFTSNFV